MYLSRITIGIILGLVWYFSDCGQVVAQLVLCVIFWPSTPTPNVFMKTRLESSTQTDDVTEDNLHQETIVDEQLVCSKTDITCAEAPPSQDRQFPKVKRSLQQVFECAYVQLVLSWYCVPEPCDSQPLHQALWTEFEQVIDRVINRGKEFDVCTAIVGCIRILTQHLNSAKQSSREPLFNSRQEEVAVLRVFSEALVRNLLPASIWGLAASQCILNEIIALKVLELLVNWLSDPDNLNQLVVSQLDIVTPKSSAEDLSEAESDRVSLEGQASGAKLEKTEDVQTAESKSKKKANKLTEGWSKFLDKMKVKKVKKKKMEKQQMSFRGSLTNEDDQTSQEVSIPAQPDSNNDDDDPESYLTSVQEDMMEFKLSYEMWRVGHWVASVPSAERENGELCFTVHLEERDNPDNLRWDVKKTQADLIHFCNLWQDSDDLPPLSWSEECTEGNIDDDFEALRMSLQNFLQELVSDSLMGNSQSVFQFLCPLDRLLNEEEHVGGVWGLFSGLAEFLAPAQEEDEDKQSSLPRGSKPEGSDSTESSDPTSIEDLEEKIGYSRNGLVQIPSILISKCDAYPPLKLNAVECCENTETVPAGKSDSFVDADNTEKQMDQSEEPITSHRLLIPKRLSRSEDCLDQLKLDIPEHKNTFIFEPQRSNQKGGSLCDLAESPLRNLCGKPSKMEKLTLKISGGINRNKGKDVWSQTKLEESQFLKKDQTSWEQMEATKAIFDLMKAISGNSIFMNIFDAILKPVMLILKKKVNSFLNKIRPTEAQLASYIDKLREMQWPEGSLKVTRPKAHRSSEDKNETKDRAQQLINARYSNYLILKKTDVETVFKNFQDREENKKLVYMLLSFLLKELLPGEDAFIMNAITLQKVNTI
ncbi:hypothetical protein UPYG_G00216440 [Umbra pygmaea]|uniref:PXA domain-containing protein n=1 Tax=Umbra pygmaea TaxID=75934 RepID=A0ABD0X4Y3_UMBPY